MDQLCVGLIGGTGLAEVFAPDAGKTHQIDTPFGPPSSAIVETRWADARVFVLSRHADGHVLNPSAVPYRANIFALKSLGCTHILASGAVGSLREEFKPRSLVVPDQIIDKTSKRANTFFDHAAVHVEFAEPFCPVLRRIVLDAGTEAQRHEGTKEEAVVYARGCYVCMEGLAFSTRAESLMHRLWGGDLIGMTAMPEAKLAREAEMAYALIALVTDYDCWRAKPADTKIDPFALLCEIRENLEATASAASQLMRRTVELMSQRRAELETSPALRALELGIWSDKSKISRTEIERLRPIWGRYFSS